MHIELSYDFYLVIKQSDDESGDIGFKCLSENTEKCASSSLVLHKIRELLNKKRTEEAEKNMVWKNMVWNVLIIVDSCKHHC